MSKFFALLTLVAAANVYAAVGVGTAVDYNVTVTNAQGTQNGVLNYTVTDYDQKIDKFKVKSTYDTGTATPQIAEDWTESANVTFGATVMSKCAQYKGVEEDVTVAAGTFKTCKVVQADIPNDYTGTFWVADVPFGIVKSLETQNGETVTLELSQVK